MQSSAPAERRNLLFRILSGLALAPPFLALAWWGGPVFPLVVALGGAFGLREWFRMVSGRPVIAAYIALAGCLGAYQIGGVQMSLEIMAGMTVILMAVARLADSAHAVLAGLGLPYVGLTVIALPWLRDTGEWPLVLLVLLIVWATDIGGFVAGRSFGGPKMAPRISPKKTWSGFAGSLALAAVAGWGWAVFFEASQPIDAILIAIGLSLVGQGGDLFESAMKRRFHLKDSGGMIPGHGGVLDRIDAMLAIVPVFALMHASDMTAGLLP